MTNRKTRFDKIYGTETVVSGLRKNNVLVLNDTLRIHHSNIAADTDGTYYYNGNISIRDSGTDNTFIPIHCKDGTFYFNTEQIITDNTLVSELNNAYYPVEGSTKLTASNIAILGQPINGDYGYINMTTAQGESGVGIRYNSTNTMIEFKNNASGGWQVLESNDLNELNDVNILNLEENQFLQYNSTTSKWNNITDIHLPGTLALGGNLIVGSNSIVDSGQNKLIGFSSNASPVNYIIIKNADTGLSPLLYSEGTDTNVGITLKSKGTGDIKLDCSATI